MYFNVAKFSKLIRLSSVH